MNLARAEALATDLMRAHLPPYWRFAWHHGLTSAGTCDTYTRTIRLSVGITKATPARYVFRTLLHEIAHALTPDEPGHGPEWAAACIRFGIRPDVYLTKEEDVYRQWARTARRRLTAAKRRG